MKQRRASCLTSVVLLFAMLLPAASVAAGKSAAKAAKSAKAASRPAAKPAAKSAAAKSSGSASSSSSSSESKPSVASTPYEVPTPAPSETAAAPAVDAGAKPAEVAPAEAPKEPAPAISVSASAEPTPVAEPTPPVVEEPPPPAEPLPLYVEHLGPSSYPGKLRGIVGGSMWLEPSFHGLQWPYMAKSGLGVSGSIWVDSGYEQIKRESPQLPNTAMYLMQGRAVLRLTPTYTNGRFFVQGQVELIGNQCQASSPICTTSGTVDTDDLWIRFGQWNAWDLKVGRFEGWELYHTGMGLDINTLERQGAQQLGFNAPGGLQAPDYYGTNWLHYRPNAGLGVGYMAFHAYPSQNFRFELLGELGADDTTNQGYTYLGGRPALVYDQGWMKLKVGAEYEKRVGDTQQIEVDSNNNSVKIDSKLKRTRWGVGGALQFVIDPVAEFGVSFAHGKQDNTPTSNGIASAVDSYTRNSVGGFGNLRLGALWLLGAGVNFTWQNDSYYFQESPSPNYTQHVQGFLALQHHLAGQLFIKAVVGYARADFVTSDESIPLWSNTMYSGRIRFMYLY